jgi:protein phosphatase
MEMLHERHGSEEGKITVNITIPEFAFVVLIGPSGAGKSTFAHKHFKSTEILSSDLFRGMVSDDENNQAASKDAFEVLHFVAAKRLAAGKLTVIDATNVELKARKPLLALAREYNCLPIAIVLNVPEALCVQRDDERPRRKVGANVVQLHHQQLRQSLADLEQEGFWPIYILDSLEKIETVEIIRQPLADNQ